MHGFIDWGGLQHDGNGYIMHDHYGNRADANDGGDDCGYTTITEYGCVTDDTKAHEFGNACTIGYHNAKGGENHVAFQSP